MAPLNRRQVGKSAAVVTELGLGCVSMGELYRRLDEATCQEVLQAAWDAGVRFFDTSPFYGRGLSELRLGHFLRQQRRDEYLLSTKVGRVLTPSPDPEHFDGAPWVGGLPFDLRFDYSYDGIRRSFEDSLQRLGLTSVDILVVHDLDFWHHRTEPGVNAYLGQLFTSGWRALDELRSSGAIKAIGAGINETGMIPRFLDLVDLDFFLVALNYTLLDQQVLDEEFPRCEELGVGAVVGAVFASGILATGPIEGAVYRYAPATPEILEKTRRIEEVCGRHGVPLRAAAVQFSLAHPIVAAIIPGALEAAQARSNAALLEHPIPTAMWDELKAEELVRRDAPVPGGESAG